MKHTWIVESTDLVLGTMVVRFSHDGDETLLNLPMPPANTDVGDWVRQYAPVQAAPDLMPVAVGASGEFSTDDSVQEATPPPNVAGSWNEEYLRAMIYQVLEEIRESEV